MTSFAVDFVEKRPETKGKPEPEIGKQLALETGGFRTYKYSQVDPETAAEDDRQAHSHYKVIGTKDEEAEFFGSPNVRNAVLVYDLIQELHCTFEPGDIVKHKDHDSMIFKAIAILASADFKKGDCLYECQTPDGKTFNYHQNDLYKGSAHAYLELQEWCMKYDDERGQPPAQHEINAKAQELLGLQQT